MFLLACYVFRYCKSRENKIPKRDQNVLNVLKCIHSAMCNAAGRSKSFIYTKACDIYLNNIMCSSPDVVRPCVMQTGCQRSRRVSLGSELHPHQGEPLLCEALPRLGRVLALQPSPVSHQMPPELQLPGQQLRQHHLHLQQGDHAPSELPSHQGGRERGVESKGVLGSFFTPLL